MVYTSGMSNLIMTMSLHRDAFYKQMREGVQRDVAATLYLNEVLDAVKKLPKDAPCLVVDPVLWQEYCEWHKDTYHYRPRHSEALTRKEVMKRFNFWESFLQ